MSGKDMGLEVNAKLLESWVEFASGSREFRIDYFHSMFMEMYLDEGLTPADLSSLRLIFDGFSNSDSIIELMVSVDPVGIPKSNDEILALVTHDLAQKRLILESRNENEEELKSIVQTIDSNECKFLKREDHQKFREATFSNVFENFNQAIISYFENILSGCDGPTRAICNAFFEIDNNIELQWMLMAEVLQIEANLRSYVGIYQAGARYCFDKEGVWILN